MCVNNSPTQINNIIKGLKSEQLNIVKWEPNNSYYPEYLFLGTDRGILAYVDFFTHVDKSDLSCELDDIVEKTRLATSDLDRPVFFIHLANSVTSFFCFETDEQVRNNLFNHPNTINGDYYMVNPFETGNLRELIEIFKSMKTSYR